MRAALSPRKGRFYSILNDCHCFVLRPGAMQFLTQVVEIFPVLVVVLRVVFPGVQQRHKALDFLKLTGHGVPVLLVVIPLGKIMFAGFAHESIKADCSRRSFDGSPSGLLLIKGVRPQSLGLISGRLLYASFNSMPPGQHSIKYAQKYAQMRSA